MKNFFFFSCREITDISILKAFIHLRYIDLSGNKLKDISSLSVLTHLLTIKADNNLLVSAKLEEMPFLQIASFNKNKIKSLEGVNHPMLEHLSLNGKIFHRSKRGITLYICFAGLLKIESDADCVNFRSNFTPYFE